jgi:hypothetical protein
VHAPSVDVWVLVGKGSKVAEGVMVGEPGGRSQGWIGGLCRKRGRGGPRLRVGNKDKFTSSQLCRGETSPSHEGIYRQAVTQADLEQGISRLDDIRDPACLGGAGL